MRARTHSPARITPRDVVIASENAAAFGSTPRQAAGGSQQELAVVRWQFAIDPQDSEFVATAAVGRRPSGAAVSKMFDADVQHLGNAGEVTGELTGAAGLPLRNSAARDADRFSQTLLRPTLVLPRIADARSDLHRVAHMLQCTSVSLTTPEADQHLRGNG